MHRIRLLFDEFGSFSPEIVHNFNSEFSRASLLARRSCATRLLAPTSAGCCSLEWFGITIFNLLRNELLLFWLRYVNVSWKFIGAIAVAYYFCHFLDGICDASLSHLRLWKAEICFLHRMPSFSLVRALVRWSSKIDLRVEHGRNASYLSMSDWLVDACAMTSHSPLNGLEPLIDYKSKGFERFVWKLHPPEYSRRWNCRNKIW